LLNFLCLCSAQIVLFGEFIDWKISGIAFEALFYYIFPYNFVPIDFILFESFLRVKVEEFKLSPSQSIYENSYQ